MIDFLQSSFQISDGMWCVTLHIENKTLDADRHYCQIVRHIAQNHEISIKNAFFVFALCVAYFIKMSTDFSKTSHRCGI